MFGGQGVAALHTCFCHGAYLSISGCPCVIIWSCCFLGYMNHISVYAWGTQCTSLCGGCLFLCDCALL